MEPNIMPLIALRRPRTLRRLVLASALVVGSGLATPNAAHAAGGQLMVTPTRLVLDGNTRHATLSLVNTGTTATTYRISVLLRRMNANGDLEEVKTPTAAEVIASKLARFSPREVTLPPGVTQNVRIQIRKPADMPPGEYRSHVLFLEVPAAETGKTSLNGLNGQKSDEVSFNITQVYGVSIPLIVRHGETSAKVGLSDMAVIPNPKPADPALLKLSLNRTGNRSVYGTITVDFIGPNGVKQVGLSPSMAIYTGLDRRTTHLPLNVPASQLKHGKLRVTFTETLAPGKQADKPLATAELALP
jgi:P pilus assembly chaperone PapD